MKNSVTVFLLFVSIGVCSAATIHVPSEQPTIQEGIDAASSGDTILIAPGTYNENLVVGDKLLTIMSSNGPNSTYIQPFYPDSSILTAESSEHLLSLEGLTFQNGTAYVGGAIRSFVRPLSLRDVNVIGCESEYSAGVTMDEGDFYAANCLFADNLAYSGSAIVIGTSDAIFDTCTFLRNVNTYGVGWGGGTIIVGGGSVWLEGCLFEDNEGCHNTICTHYASIVMHECTVRNGKSNGCIWDDWGSLPGSIRGSFEDQVTISNCLIEGIDGWAIGLPQTQIEIDNSTFAGNSGVLLFEFYAGGFVTIENSIISDNGSVYERIFGLNPDPMNISCTDIYGNATGDWVGYLEPIADSLNNFSADPRFCDTINDNFHIDAYSPCAPDYSPCGQLIGALSIGCQSSYICGDADISGASDIDDVVYLIEYIFMNGISPIPIESGDADCSSDVDIDDVVYVLNYIFANGPAPCDPNGDEVPDC